MQFLFHILYASVHIFFQFSILGQSNPFKLHSQPNPDNTLYGMYSNTVLDAVMSPMAHFPLMHHCCVNKYPEVTLQEVKLRSSTPCVLKVDQTHF